MRFISFLGLIIACFLPIYLVQGADPAAFETVRKMGHWTPGSLDSLIQSDRTRNTGERVSKISASFLGTPYKGATLIGGPHTPEKLVINLQGMDCFTYLDYVLALAMSDSYPAFSSRLRTVRYKDGVVNYRDRNHFFAQWIRNNRLQYVRLPADSCEKRILNQKDSSSFWVEGVSAFAESLCFLPIEKIRPQILGELKSGDFLGIVSKLPGLDVSHVGIVIRKKKAVLFRHASSAEKKVVDEPLLSYLKRAGKSAGIVVARLPAPPP